MLARVSREHFSSGLPELYTERLKLRPMRDDDAEPLAVLGADARVMEHLLGVMTRSQSDALLARLRQFDPLRGLGCWAVEVPERTSFAGLVMLKQPGFAAPFQPCVEIGWRFGAEHWGQGYASEAARALLAYGFDRLDLPEIVAFTVPANLRSQRVMDRIGLRRDPAADFEHPLVPPGHRLRAHVLYRLTREAWRREAARC
jgi:RimJ/RimL family protein N-acetyltransferase